MKRRKKKIKRRKKVSSNPFKMWGSWVGAILILLSPVSAFGFGGIFIFSQIPRIANGNMESILATVGTIIVGFLIGWGIHSGARWVQKWLK